MSPSQMDRGIYSPHRYYHSLGTAKGHNSLKSTSDHRLSGHRLQKLQELITQLSDEAGVDDQYEESCEWIISRKPMTVSQWNRSVHRLSQVPRCPQANTRPNGDLRARVSLDNYKFCSPPAVQPSCQFFDPATLLSEDEVIQKKCNVIARPSKVKSQLGTDVKRISIKPLIDLNQATDSDGRPVDNNQRLIKRSSMVLSRLESESEEEQRTRAEVEQCHRVAIRKLQATAVDRLEQARCDVNRMKYIKVKNGTIDSSRMGDDEENRCRRPSQEQSRRTSRAPSVNQFNLRLRRLSGFGRMSEVNFPMKSTNPHPTQTTTTSKAKMQKAADPRRMYFENLSRSSSSVHCSCLVSDPEDKGGGKIHRWIRTIKSKVNVRGHLKKATMKLNCSTTHLHQSKPDKRHHLTRSFLILSSERSEK